MYFGNWDSGPSWPSSHSQESSSPLPLTKECDRIYSDRIKIERDGQVEGGNKCKCEVVLESASGAHQTPTFDLVVGAVGHTSVARSLMQQHVCFLLVYWIPGARSGEHTGNPLWTRCPAVTNHSASLLLAAPERRTEACCGHLMHLYSSCSRILHIR